MASGRVCIDNNNQESDAAKAAMGDGCVSNSVHVKWVCVKGRAWLSELSKAEQSRAHTSQRNVARNARCVTGGACAIVCDPPTALTDERHTAHTAHIGWPCGACVH